MRYFTRCYRVITWNYRGLPLLEVPSQVASYADGTVGRRPRRLLRHLGIEQAHIAGLSMGGALTLKFGLAHPEVVGAW